MKKILVNIFTSIILIGSLFQSNTVIASESQSSSLPSTYEIDKNDVIEEIYAQEVLNGLGSSELKSIQDQIMGNLSQQAYIKASNTDISDFFSVSAISENTIVIGAEGEDSNTIGINGNQKDNSAENSGAAYVFVRNGVVWSQQAYLKASNTGAGDQFGKSVAIYGDTIVVGAEGEDSNATGVNGNTNDNSLSNSGAAYVFVRSGNTWSQQAYLKASNTGLSDEFGVYVSIFEDTIVIGAMWEDSNSTGVNGNQNDDSYSSSGAAYVFVRNGTIWSQQAYLKASNTGAGDYFGESVAISGNTIVIGAVGEDSNAMGVNGNQDDNSSQRSGAAYVFLRTDTAWSQQAYLKASNTGTGDNFGQSVAISGDTIVIGASSEDSSAIGVNGDESDNGAAASGAAYIFMRSSMIWFHQAYLKASNTEENDSFGWSVAISGAKIVIGAYHEDSLTTGINGNQLDNNAEASGAAYFFINSGSTWIQQAYLKASNTQTGDAFAATAISGDTFVIVAGFEDSSATGIDGNQSDNNARESGAAYIFFIGSTQGVDLDVQNSQVVLSDSQHHLKENQPSETVLETIVTNHGPDPTTRLTVEFHDGFPSTDTKIASTTLYTINSGDSATARVNWEPDSSPIEANIYVKVSTIDNDIDISNNISAEGTIILIAYADFLYNPDTFKFSNSAIDKLDFFDGLSVYSNILDTLPLRLIYRKIIIPSIYALKKDAGHCYGMSTASIIYKDTPSVKPVSLNTFEMDWEIPEVAQDIEAMHFRQILKNFIDERLGSTFFPSRVSPKTAYVRIKDRLIMDGEKMSVLSLFDDFWLADYIHAVTPYKIIEIDNHKYIFIYDNNYPMNLDNPYADIISLDEINNLFFHQTNKKSIPKAIATEPARSPSEITSEFLEDIIESVLSSLKTENMLQGYFEWNANELNTEENPQNAIPLQTINTYTHFIIVDSSNHRLGYDNGVFVNDIPGSHFINLSSGYYWLLPVSDSYTLELKGLGYLDNVLSFAIPLNKSFAQTTIYDGFSIPQDATVSTSFSQTTTDWRIEIEGQEDVLPVIDEEIPVEGPNEIFLPLIMRE